MQTYQQTGMAYSVQQASKLVVLIAALLAGCAAPEPKTIYKEINRIERIPEKPFKVCPDEPKDDDYPCIKLGPTKTLGVQGYYVPR